MKKIAIVTGCSSDIGSALSLELARDGYNIIGTYNNDINSVNKLNKKIDMIGVKFYPYQLNLLDEDEINKFIEYIKLNYEHIDLLINNAAISLDNELNLKTYSEFIDVLKVNLVAPFLLIKELSNLMNDGIIVNISSTDGINTYSKYNIDYSASKAGLINLTKSMALELNNIKLYCICPNWVNTKNIRQMNIDYLNEEMKRIGQNKLLEPSDISNKLLSLIESNMKSGSVIVMEDKYD